MKRDFLKNLGIEDKDTIDAILNENSADIGRAKGELDTYKNQVSDLQSTIATKDSEISTLRGQVGEVESLRNQVTQLQNDKNQLTNDLNTKVSEIKKSHAIESGVRDAKAKNIKAVVAQLDMTKITFENDVLAGLTEQLEALKSGEDTAFLFGESQSGSPSGTQPSNPNSNGGTPPTSTSFAEAVAKALTTKN